MAQTEPNHITGIEISGFRGIKKGNLDGLAPLTVLVGTNSAGKSTVLEALYLGLTDRPIDGLFHCIRRRPDLVDGAKWLFFDKKAAQIQAAVQISRSDQAMQIVLIAATRPAAPSQPWQAQLTVNLRVAGAGKKLFAIATPVPGRVSGAQPNSPTLGEPGLVPDVRFIESLGSLSDVALTDRLTQAAEQGRRAEVDALLGDVLSRDLRLEVLTAEGVPYVGLTMKDGAFPLGAVGDGIQLLVRQCLELAALPGGVALVEEPEAHKHPAALRSTAKAIVAAVKRGVQVVLSTHSLELIDDLVSECNAESLAKMALFRLSLSDGLLRTSRLAGSDVQAMRSDIAEDLR
ncbi:MAG: AAA family ATPase [Deltaproteobacteria bacterium]|nr:AAA family ATPase [Deltaproteobacteria bacterium]